MNSLSRAAFMLIITGCFGIYAPLVVGAEKRAQSTQERLQGVWTRPNADHVFVIQGKTVVQRQKSKPLSVHCHGELQFPAGKPYAEVKLSSGWTLWIFPVSEDNLVTEDFKPDGTLAGTGYLMYRQEADSR